MKQKESKKKNIYIVFALMDIENHSGVGKNVIVTLEKALKGFMHL